MCHLSHVMCHVSCVTCHMSCVMCHMSQFFFSSLWQRWSLAVEGSLSTGPTPSSLLDLLDFWNLEIGNISWCIQMYWYLTVLLLDMNEFVNVHNKEKLIFSGPKSRFGVHSKGATVNTCTRMYCTSSQRLSRSSRTEIGKSRIRETLNLLTCADSSTDKKYIKEINWVSRVSCHVSCVTCPI